MSREILGTIINMPALIEEERFEIVSGKSVVRGWFFLCGDAANHLKHPLPREEKRGISLFAQERLAALACDYYNSRLQSKVRVIVKKRRAGLRQGQPYLKINGKEDSKKASASVSHCDYQAAVCFTTSGLVGIDLEKVDRLIQPLFFSGEMNAVRQAQKLSPGLTINASFILIWTMKEAFLKALGVGFRRGLNSVRILDIDWGKGRVVCFLSEELWNALKNKPGTVQFYIAAKPEIPYFISVALLK